MKTRLLIFLSILIGMGAMFNPAANAIALEINVGDHAYYEGPEFWDYGWRYVWVPGHYQHHRWIHGYYQRHGDWNHRYMGTHHSWNHHDHDHDHDHHDH
jgi:hypothetical protein